MKTKKNSMRKTRSITITFYHIGGGGGREEKKKYARHWRDISGRFLCIDSKKTHAPTNKKYCQTGGKHTHTHTQNTGKWERGGGLNYLRMLAVISSGCISVLVATLVDEKPFPHNWQVWSLMAGSGALYGVGIVCLNYALWPHCTAMALSIVTGGSSVVSVVSFVIAERTAMPPIVKLAGISLVALAIVSIVVMMCVSACQQEPDDDADDADEFGKHGRVVLGSAESLRVDRAITFH
eukprot:GEMP01056399.1.p1 GENE.GEMP01056399.1~~GEMP01056399.1.p1  ORF type:complete len:237 (-),score=42.80 GEMP01056399.1:748-1458(-)